MATERIKRRYTIAISFCYEVEAESDTEALRSALAFALNYDDIKVQKLSASVSSVRELPKTTETPEASEVSPESKENEIPF